MKHRAGLRRVRRVRRQPWQHTARLVLLVLLGLLCRPVRGETLEFHAPAEAAGPRTPQVMRDLAARIIPVYHDTDRARYLANLSALQMVAGSYAAAYAARLSLDEVRRKRRIPPALDAVAYDLHARALALKAEEGIPYHVGFAQSFDAAVAPLGDLAAYRLIEWLKTAPEVFRSALQNALDRYRGQDRISMSDALALIWTYLAFDAHRSFAPLVASLAAADDRRRYVIDDKLLIKTPDGASLAARVVRPRRAGRLAALLSFRSSVSAGNDATECAAHGYAGVVAYARRGGGWYFPYEHEVNDTHAVISWITSQGWSDGRVGMYGSGYSAFAAWAAAKGAPLALKTIVAASATAPGINMPMEGGIFRNAAYRWLISVSGDDGAHAAEDSARWRALDERYYSTGRPYRDLDRLFGVPSRAFHRWLDHPSYDRYWQSMVPGPKALKALAIPVLTLTGYFDPGEEGALYYFIRYHRYNPLADDTLLAGPYDARALSQGPAPTLDGYTLDPAALIDLHELRYQWFDHVLRGGPRPPVLAGRVNYEVMGANTWRHRSSLSMGSAALQLYLTPRGQSGGVLQVKPGKPTAFVQQTVDLAARSPIPPPADPALVTSRLAARDSLVFVSDPLREALELAGRPKLRLALLTNKWDVDLIVSLYEQLPGGGYLKLYSPPYEQRASYARDRRRRHFLKRGVLERLTLRGARLVGCRVEAGSRLVLVLGVKKRPDEEIDYGSGKDVSQESIGDGRRPLTIRWYGSSSLDLPVWR